MSTSSDIIVDLQPTAHAIPPQNQVDITFHQLSYTVPHGKHHKIVLDGFSGLFRPGRLTVILGASGAGKTSLLNTLSGRAAGGWVSGEIKVNGHVVSPTELRKMSGYVHQDDIMMDTQTVREAVYMSAHLRIPSTVSDEEKRARVENVIALMHIEKCADTLIGGPLIKGISGGERKRTSIAMELVSNPPILFLDEPTSGLDTFNAFTTVRYLKELALSGRTVVASLHQPSSEIFHLADDLILMSEGNVLYNGPADESVDYFAQHGHACPKFTNPADFFFMSVFHSTDSANVTLADETKRGQDELGKLIQAWPQSPQGKAAMDTVMRTTTNGTKEDIPSRTFRANFWTQFVFLLRRAWLDAMRNKMVVKVKIVQMLVFVIMIDLIYNNIPKRGEVAAQIQDRAGVLFFQCVYLVLAFAMSNLAMFSLERHVFEREYSARMYSLPAYFLSKSLVDLPTLVLIPVVYVVLTYFVVGLQFSASKFIVALIGSVLLANCGASLGLWAASTFRNLTVALTVLPILLIPLMIFSGLFVNLNSMPVWIRWVQWLSPMKYGFVALAQNEFNGLKIGCIQLQDECVGGLTGEVILIQLALDGQGGIALNLIALAAFWIFLWLLAYLGLWRAVRYGAKKAQHLSVEAHHQLLSKHKAL